MREPLTVAGANGSAPEHVRVAIVGAGFSGLGLAIRLRQAGIGDIAILEKADEVGGTWRENTYPGVACDVPSHLYSLSFAPNPGWSRMFAPGAEIQEYLVALSRSSGVRPLIRFGCEVTGADWDETARRWRIRTSRGELSAQVLVSAPGPLHEPALPDVPGLDAFQGTAFHSATWDHDHDLTGERVAVVGTGASAIQFVPEIAREAARLTVFQRTPSYILPRPDRAYSEAERRRFARWPWLMKAHRALIYVAHDARAVGFTRMRWMIDIIGGMPARRLLKAQVPDAALRERMTPRYPIGCKRILISNDWLPTFSRPNVELVTDAIEAVTPAGVRVAGGREIEVDAIVLGTGFAANEFLAPMCIRGRGGRSLNDAWAQGAQAWLGITVPGFPNFFMIYGPNTNLGHNSIVFMLESQVAHVLRCLRKLRGARAATIEVSAPPFERYNARLQQRQQGTVFAGCTSWYVDAHGRHTVNWPGFTTTYRWLTRYAGLGAYTVE